MTLSASNRRASAVDALSEAVSHMREKLFPFNFVGWITLGFVSLLESCASGSGTGGVQNQMAPPGSFEDPAKLLEGIFGWIAAHMLIFVTVLMVLMVLSMVFMWLRARTIFVYIDDVASGRFDLARPWKEHGALADSYFAMSLVVQGASFILLVLIVGVGGFFALWAKAHEWPGLTIALGALPILFIFVLALVAAAVLNMALRDFVAPIQIARNIGASAALRAFLSFLTANPGLMVGYALLKFVVSLGVGIVVMIATCLTCCIGALPLVNQTLFQPIYYAERAWSLKLLAQLGDDVFAKLTPPPSRDRKWENDTPTEPIDLSQVPDEPVPDEPGQS